jgi:hypothetical protein
LDKLVGPGKKAASLLKPWNNGLQGFNMNKYRTYWKKAIKPGRQTWVWDL